MIPLYNEKLLLTEVGRNLDENICDFIENLWDDFVEEYKDIPNVFEFEQLMSIIVTNFLAEKRLRRRHNEITKERELNENNN